MTSVKQRVFETCQQVFPRWRELSWRDFDFAEPKGFSSFTMGIRARCETDPPAVLYRHLEGKENAILDGPTERRVFLALGAAGIAAHCYHYDETCRLERFFRGRTLRADEVFEPEKARQIADALYRFHQLSPEGLPSRPFFELLHEKWGPQAKAALVDQRDRFPAHERPLCEALTAIYSDETAAKVRRCLPSSELTFCHNDTYHGNIMTLEEGGLKLLDFEFSCLNHRAFDFANLFAETVMEHGLPDEPYFRIAAPRYGGAEIERLIGYYLDNQRFPSEADRETALSLLTRETEDMIMLSDYMYAMAALPLALKPIQKLRFLPYAAQRFAKFLRAYDARFP